MAEMPEDSRKVAGGTRKSTERERQASAAAEENAQPKATDLMEEVLRRENLIAALHRVQSNKGAPGVDGMTVEALTPYLKENWPRIREELLSGQYDPAPVRRVEIPKPDGKGMRLLGIPTVLDRFIQQAILQVLTPIFDPHFSESSYGFRPGRGCHGAVRAAASPRGSRLSLGGGHGPGKVLRPCEPRRAYGTGGQTGQGQATPSTHPALS